MDEERRQPLERELGERVYVERYQDGSFFLRLCFDLDPNQGIEVTGYDTWKSDIGWYGVIHAHAERSHIFTRDVRVWAFTEPGVRRKIARQLLAWKAADRRLEETRRSA